MLGQVEYRFAQNPVEKDAIYRLRYRAYLHEGAIKLGPPKKLPIGTTNCRIRGPSASTSRVSSPAPSVSAF